MERDEERMRGLQGYTVLGDAREKEKTKKKNEGEITWVPLFYERNQTTNNIQLTWKEKFSSRRRTTTSWCLFKLLIPVLCIWYWRVSEFGSAGEKDQIWQPVSGKVSGLGLSIALSSFCSQFLTSDTNIHFHSLMKFSLSMEENVGFRCCRNEIL